MKISRRLITSVILSVIAVIIMTFIENHLQYGYWFKSMMKIIVFGGSIFLYSLIYRESTLKMINMYFRVFWNLIYLKIY